MDSQWDMRKLRERWLADLAVRAERCMRSQAFLVSLRYGLSALVHARVLWTEKLWSEHNRPSPRPQVARRSVP